MRALEPWHLLVLLVVVLVLFGGKRLPDAARGLGRSMRIFKAEVKDLHDDDKPRSSAPLEGRVMDDDAQTRSTTTGSAAGEAHQADQKRGA